MPLQEPVALSLGFVAVYLVPSARGCVLVDAGVPKQEEKIFAGMAKHGLAPKDIRLVLITHAHGDHVGSLQAVAKRSGATVVAHRIEAPLLADGIPLHPHGLTTMGKIANKFMGGFAKQAGGYPCKPDILVDDERPLADFGVKGRVIHTPGHTSGSLSLLLDTGDAIVGDLCARFSPLPGASYVPMFGEDRDAVYASWKRLLEAGATRILPAHGAPFPAERLRKELARAGRA